MIKFGGKAGEQKLIGLGLSAENIHRLQDGKPIVVDGSEFDDLDREAMEYAGLPYT